MESCREVAEIIGDCDLKEYTEHKVIRLATERLLGNIGEALNGVRET